MADNKVNSGLLEFSEDQKVFVALDAETSEVKKAVTIDGDGAETNIQGVTPTGKKEITSTAEVNVASYATAQVVDEDLVAGNIKKDVDILGVVGSYEPEVPASDFSTAEVTIVKSETLMEWAMVMLYSEYNMLVTEYGAPASGTYIIPLYKGKLIISTNGLGNVTVSGNCEYADDQFTITGDCTITISEKRR